MKAGDWPPETETQSKKEKAEEATAMIAQKLWTRLCQSSRKTLILKVVPRSPRSHAITVVSLVTLQGIVQSQRGNRTTRNRYSGRQSRLKTLSQRRIHTVDSVLYKGCDKCRGGKGFWTSEKGYIVQMSML